MNARSQIATPPVESVEDYLGCRVVLTCHGELSFCGVARAVLVVGTQRGLLVQTDPQSGFSVWCPLDYAKSITVIPIPVEDPEAPSHKATP